MGLPEAIRSHTPEVDLGVQNRPEGFGVLERERFDEAPAELRGGGGCV